MHQPAPELHLELTASPSALARVVACLHAKGAAVEGLHLDGRRCRVVLRRDAPVERVAAALRRLVDVVACEVGPAAATRVVVLREPSARPSTPHRWAA